MSIGNGDTSPLPAVHGVVETHSWNGTDRSPHPARPNPEGAAGPTAAAEPEAPGIKSVQLPEFPNYELSFRLDEQGGRVMVQVIDAKTGEVVRTLPPEDLGPKLRRLPDGRGVLLDREG